MGLPLEDIEALGLYKIPGGRYRLMIGLGVMESDTYSASVRIGDDRAPGCSNSVPAAPNWLRIAAKPSDEGKSGYAEIGESPGR